MYVSETSNLLFSHRQQRLQLLPDCPSQVVVRWYLLIIFNNCLQILNCLNGARAAQSYQPHPSFATIAQTHYVEACRHNSCTERYQNDVCQYYIKDTNCWYYLSKRSNKTIASSSPICIQASGQPSTWKNNNIGMLPRAHGMCIQSCTWMPALCNPCWNS